MHAPHLSNPFNPMQVASSAQNMAKNDGRHDRMAIAFQSVALISMAVMGTVAAVHLLRDLRRDDHHGRGR